LQRTHPGFPGEILPKLSSDVRSRRRSARGRHRLH
jgi:hypothetical protein